MSIHLFYPDFFRFLDALAQGPADPWALYEEYYLAPHRVVLEAWWEQVLGLPQSAWMDRVRQVRPQEYGVLSMVIEEGDLTALAQDTLARCQSLLPLTPEPDIYFLVGFFSPDAFIFRVAGEWAIGIGLERFRSQRLMPILLAHEYVHMYRKRELGEAVTLGERLVEEGMAVAFSAGIFPERPTYEHFLMHPGQLAVLQQYAAQLWETIQPQLASTDEKVAARVLYGREERGRWPSRAGVYLGWNVARAFLEKHPGRFAAAAEEVLAGE